MKINKIPDAYRWLFSIGAPALVCLIGWGQVINQNHQLRTKTLQAYQAEQHRVLKLIAQMIGREIVQARQSTPNHHSGDIQQTIITPILKTLGNVESDQAGQFYAISLGSDLANTAPQLSHIPLAELRRWPRFPAQPADQIYQWPPQNDRKRSFQPLKVRCLSPRKWTGANIHQTWSILGLRLRFLPIRPNRKLG